MKNMDKKGFSLVELLVASALFITVVAVSSGSFLSTLDASQRARELQELSSNLDFVLEDMSRNIRTSEEITSCGDTSCSFDAYDLETDSSYSVTYDLSNGGEVLKSISESSADLNDVPLTTPDIDITDLDFTLKDGGSVQPRIIIRLVAETTGDIEETYYLQTSITQRALDN